MDTTNQQKNKIAAAFIKLVDVMAILREPDGCPWDRQQDSMSLRPYLIEEAYEVIEAIESGDHEWLCEELGDLLLQVVFHAQIHSESHSFTVVEVIEGISNKLIRRHPHVFGSLNSDDMQELKEVWEEIKNHEKSQNPRRKNTSIETSMPALMQGQKFTRHRELDSSNLPQPLQDAVEFLSTCPEENVHTYYPRFILKLLEVANARQIDAETSLKDLVIQLSKTNQVPAP